MNGDHGLFLRNLSGSGKHGSNSFLPACFYSFTTSFYRFNSFFNFFTVIN